MKILQTKTVPGLWSAYTFPLKPGTPIDKDGAVSNDGDAIGIVMETIAKAPDTKSDMLSILIGGYVDAGELGYELSDAAVQAMQGITIYDANGTGMSNALPAVTTDDNGKVLGVSSGAWAAVEGGTGGGDVFVVPVTITVEGDTPTLSTNVAVADVIAAAEAGKAVLYTMYFALIGGYAIIVEFTIGNGEITFTFNNSQVIHDADGIRIYDGI